MATPTEPLMETLSSPTPPRRAREGEGLQQYYIAVDRQKFKMDTFVQMLLVLGRRASLPIAICCSARDSLDAVCARISAAQQFSLLFLHSDQGDSERAVVLSNFHAIVRDWNHGIVKSSVSKLEGDDDEKVEAKKPGILVTTDACLPSATLGEPSLGARVLIHYDLPAKKHM
uniref:Helicase C-terminal domain-containing protein n=1 Tax=Physcomitrium patens TaxID=3218 RepID=A0A7I4AFA7_PHYPA